MSRSLLRAVSVLVGCCVLASCASFSDKNNEPFMGEEEPTVEEMVLAAEQAVAKRDVREAIIQYEKALDENPAFPGLKLALASLHLQLSHYQRAETLFSAILAEEPTNRDALEGLGFCQVKQQRFDEAKATLVSALESHPDSHRAMTYLGVIADIEGRYEDAETFYIKALALSPKDVSILNNYGYSQLMARHYSKAEDLLIKALAMDPQNAERIRNNLSLTQAWQKKYEEAILTLSPSMDDPVAYNNVGYIALLNKDYGNAIQLFEKAMSLSPRYYQRAAVNLQRAKRLQAAVAASES